MPAISIQNNANVSRHQSLFDLAKQSALVNPIKKAEEQRCGFALIRPPSLSRRSCCDVPPDVERGRDSLFIKGQRNGALVRRAPIGFHILHPVILLPHG
jgi:hypothetical protein